MGVESSEVGRGLLAGRSKDFSLSWANRSCFRTIFEDMDQENEREGLLKKNYVAGVTNLSRRSSGLADGAWWCRNGGCYVTSVHATATFSKQKISLKQSVIGDISQPPAPPAPASQQPRTMTTVAGRLLFHRLQKPLLRQRLLRSLSTLDPLSDPAKFISGLTSEDVEKNEEIAAFIAANFEPPPGPDEPSPWSVKSDEAKVEKESQPDAAEHLNIRKIHCFLRDPAEEEGSRRCQDLRASRNQIPGLLYGGNPDLGISSRDSASKIFVKTPWNVLHREFDLFHRAVESRVYDLTVYQDEYDTLGTVHRVLPTDVQWHPIRRTLFCINYLRYHPLRPIKIPIVYVNEEESPVMKRGGFIAPVNRYVSCLVEEGVPIPERLELECAGLKLKEVVRLDRIIFPEGVRMSKRGKPEKFVIGTVFGSRGDKDDDEAQEKETKVAAAKKA